MHPNQLKMLIYCLLFPVFLFSVKGEGNSVDIATLRAEIEVYREKIEATTQKIEYEKKKAINDSLSYSAYLGDYLKRKSSIDAEMDSLSNLSAMLQQRRDSLGREEALVYAQKESYSSQITQISAVLRQQCSQMLDTISRYELFNISEISGGRTYCRNCYCS